MEKITALFSDICPFCGTENNVSSFNTIFESLAEEKKPFDPYDWDDSDNCTNREYVDDDYVSVNSRPLS